MVSTPNHSSAAAVAERLHRTIETLLDVADHHGGLLPSILDPRTLEMPAAAPRAIPGQREGDRAHRGCNLSHDLILLRTIEQLGQSHRIARYTDAVDHYLRRFHAFTDTPSGLFPWGEHAYIRLDCDALGNSIADASGDRRHPVIHDHLRAVPRWFWDRFCAIAPRAVARFAHGLNYHLKEGEPVEYSRHACIDAGDPALTDHPGYERSGRPKRLTGPADGANDFPRHSGFYCLDLACAWKTTGDPAHLALLRVYLDYWWDQADREGALPLQSRGPDQRRLIHQTLSLAVSLDEAADAIEAVPGHDPVMRDELRFRARTYAHRCMEGPAEDRLPVLLHPQTPVWGSEYGHSVAVVCRYALLLATASRRLGDARLLSWAEQLGNRITATPLTQVANRVPAVDVGMALGALAELFEITGDARWRDGGIALAIDATASFMTHRLPVGARGIDWYESQLGTGYLLHGLARVVSLAEGGPSIESDCSNR